MSDYRAWNFGAAGVLGNTLTFSTSICVLLALLRMALIASKRDFIYGALCPL